MSKEKRNKYIEHKNKVRGSIRVWKSDIFYDLNALIDDVTISDETSTARLSPSCCTNELRAILERYEITFTPGQHIGTKLREEAVSGLDYDSIRTIKNDLDHLRIRYSADKDDDLANVLVNAITILTDLKISFGEPDGELVCLRGACIGMKQLKKMQKVLIE